MGKINFTQFNRLRTTPRPIEDAFWEKVDKKSSDECWEWIASIQADGYGNFKGKLAHRVSWELANGEIIKGLCVCHKCDNPACVNPNHLFLGTQLDNMRDMVSKGRGHDHHGENNPKAKLTEKDVFQIHRLKNSGVSNREIANDFGVTSTTISYILAGKTWISVFNRVTRVSE